MEENKLNYDGSNREWKLYTSMSVVSMHRSGWKGVLDEIKATITKKPRFSVATPVTISFYCLADSNIKPAVNPDFSITSVQIEMGKQIGRN